MFRIGLRGEETKVVAFVHGKGGGQEMGGRGCRGLGRTSCQTSGQTTERTPPFLGGE